MDRFGGVSGRPPFVVTGFAILATLVAVTVSGTLASWQAAPLVPLGLGVIGWLYRRQRRANQAVAPVLKRLADAATVLERAESEDQIAATAGREIAGLLDTERAALVPVNQGRLVIDRGSGALVINPGHERGFVRDVAISGQTANVVTHPSSGRAVALLGVPVAIDESVVGVLVAVRDSDRPFTVTEQHVLTRLSPSVAEALRSLRETARRSTSGRDPVTGFANRDQLDADVRDVRNDRRHGTVALALVDIDQFRRMIERFGRNIQDQVVAAVADVLRAQVRGHDSLYRFDTDEFCVILRNMRSDQAVTVLNRVRRAIRAIVIPGGGPGEDTQVTVSIGVAFVYPSDPGRALRAASDAVQDAATDGGDRVVLGSDSPFDHASLDSDLLRQHPGLTGP